MLGIEVTQVNKMDIIPSQFFMLNTLKEQTCKEMHLIIIFNEFDHLTQSW